MTSRSLKALAITGAVLLLAMAALHGSGYPYVADELQTSQLPDFLKRVLPPLYLYPSAIMIVIALAILVSLKYRSALAPMLAFAAAVVAANAVLGFALGGVVPGGVLLLAAAMFMYAALKAKH